MATHRMTTDTIAPINPIHQTRGSKKAERMNEQGGRRRCRTAEEKPMKESVELALSIMKSRDRSASQRISARLTRAKLIQAGRARALIISPHNSPHCSAYLPDSGVSISRGWQKSNPVRHSAARHKYALINTRLQVAMTRG
jgi:hypothetical protein